MGKRPRTAVPGSRRSHNEHRATSRQASCPMVQSSGARVSGPAAHLAKIKATEGHRDSHLSPFLETCISVSSSACKQAQSSPGSLPEPGGRRDSCVEIRHSQTSLWLIQYLRGHGPFKALPFPVPPPQHLLSHQERPETLQSQFRQ